MRSPGGREVLEVADVPKPAPSDDQVLVRVRAASINAADLVQRRGFYPPPPGVPEDILGLDFAGEVEVVGDHVRGFKTGDRVMGLVGGAAQAEYVVIHQDLAIKVPDLVEDIEAGAIPEAYMTAHDALFSQARLEQGERVLIHAIGSGVGVAAAQLARAHSCTVIGTSRSAEKVERAMKLGIDEGIDVADGKFADTVLEATDGIGVDVIVDFVGAAYFEQNLRALAPRGRIVFLSTLGGRDAQLPIYALMRKRATLIGTVLRTRSHEEKVVVRNALVRDVLPLFAQRQIQVPIDRVFSLEDAADAHRYLEEHRNFGKVVFSL